MSARHQFTRKQRIKLWRHLGLFMAAATITVLVGSCSNNDAGDDSASAAIDNSESDMNSNQMSASTFNGNTISEVSQPEIEGKGIHYPQPATGIPENYLEEEFFVSGLATQFDAVDTPLNGMWVATPASEADYQTRVIVRRPVDAEDFSGTVLVEWFNVSAIEAAPDWGFLHEAITREGHAYIGVSVQAQGVIGGDPILGVDVDAAAAADQGVSTGTGGLTSIDAERYGSLTHPGDAYSFDIYAQVGKAATAENATLLGGLAPDRVIAMGESQSAMFLTTYINAVHVLDPVYDGFLVHSRGSMVPAMNGEYVSNRDQAAATSETNGVLIREDLDVPTMIVIAETDLTVLGYAAARQDDTDLIRTWEIAGTAHADAETLRAVIGGPRDPNLGDLLGCGPINTGPHKEVLRAGLNHLIQWVDGGNGPPTSPRIELSATAAESDSGQAVIARDDHGNALGGIRTPMVDVPAATLTGDPATSGSIEELTGGGDICMLFGQTIAFDAAKLRHLYGDFDTYISEFRTVADQVVAAELMIDTDAEALVVDMETNRSLFDE